MEKDQESNIHRTFAHVRFYSGLSRNHVAEKLGVTSSYVREVERGKTIISAPYYYVFCRFFDLNLRLTYLGHIDYLKVAEKFNNQKILQSIKGQGKTIKVQSLLELFHCHYGKNKPTHFFEPLLKKYNLRAEYLAEPKLEIPNDLFQGIKRELESPSTINLNHYRQRKISSFHPC